MHLIESEITVAAVKELDESVKADLEYEDPDDGDVADIFKKHELRPVEAQKVVG